MQAVIRAVCAIIDSFHFTVDLVEDPALADGSTAAASLPQLPDGAGRTATPSGEEAEEEAGDEKGATEVNEKQEASGREIMSALTKRVLPVLQSVLVSRILPVRPAA